MLCISFSKILSKFDNRYGAIFKEILAIFKESRKSPVLKDKLNISAR